MKKILISLILAVCCFAVCGVTFAGCNKVNPYVEAYCEYKVQKGNEYNNKDKKYIHAYSLGKYKGNEIVEIEHEKREGVGWNDVVVDIKVNGVVLTSFPCPRFDLLLYTSDSECMSFQEAYDSGIIDDSDIPALYEIIRGEKYDSGEGFENDLVVPEGLTREQTADIVRAFFARYRSSFVENKEIRNISVGHYLGTYGDNIAVSVKVGDTERPFWVFEEYKNEQFETEKDTMLFIYKKDGTGEGLRAAHEAETVSDGDYASILATAQEKGLLKEKN